MKTKNLEKFEEELSNLSIQDIWEKRNMLIKKMDYLFGWGILFLLLGFLVGLLLSEINPNISPIWYFGILGFFSIFGFILLDKSISIQSYIDILKDQIENRNE